MEILDRVYKTFVNFDRDFSKSKKTRAQFITDKLGGDIAIGSMIILDAVSADADSNSPEDVRKLTFIKKMIAQIKSAGAGLDSLDSFRSLESSSEMDGFLAVLNKALQDGTHIRALSQSAMVKETKDSVHVCTRMYDSVFVPIADSRVLYPFNNNFAGHLLQRYRFEGEVQLCQYYALENNQVAKLTTPERVLKMLQDNGKATA